MPTRTMSPTLLDHLHASFLSGRAADVVLRVLGPWRAEYRMHKVVLLQAGFFEMLFEGGYREALGQGKPVELTFEDPNITRAAFELCLAHLYHPTSLPSLPTSYLPTPAHPLTPAFPSPPLPSPVPRLLLSLLATSSYLHIPLITTEATRVLLGSVSPWTVARYLGFAIGYGLGEAGEAEIEVDEGIKGLGHDFRDDPASRAPSSSASSIVGDDDRAQETASDSDDDLHTSKSTATSVSPTSTPTPSHSTSKPTLLTSYGTPTNLLGQTCVSWLCRWGCDVLPYEEFASTPRSMRVWGAGGIPAAWARTVLSSDEFWVREEVERWDVARRVVDMRREGWREMHGLDALRRGRTDERQEEGEWERLFEEGVYYEHMTFDSLTKISHAVSPHTGKSYTPMRVLQRANWGASLLRSAVVSSNTLVLPHAKPGEIGLLHTTDALLSASPGTEFKMVEAGEDEAYFAVPPDDAQRIGDWNPAGVVAGMSAIPPGGKSRIGYDERVWFGIGNKRRTLREIIASASVSGNAPGLDRNLGWTKFEPYRFSVEFFSASSLKLDKTKQLAPASSAPGHVSKIHSRTMFYAGSLFNVYIQVVRKKKDDKDVVPGSAPATAGADRDTQLGVYVQRWSMVNPVPPASAPPRAAAVHSTSSVPPPAHASSHSSGSAPGHRREESAASTHSINAFAQSLAPAPSASTSSFPLHLATQSTLGGPPSLALGRAPTPTPIPFPRSTTPSRQLVISASASSFLSRSASPPIPGTPTNVHSPGPPTPVTAGPSNSQSPPSSYPFPASPTGLITSTPISVSTPASYPPTAPPTPYRDPRQTMRAYFAVTCCSSLGAVLTRFSSAPDKFDVGQSWGWKSSCLREGAGEEGVGNTPGAGVGADGGLRVTVVIGLV